MFEIVGQPANQRLSSQIAIPWRISERMPPAVRHPMAPHSIFSGYLFRHIRGLRRARPSVRGRAVREGAGGRPLASVGGR